MRLDIVGDIILRRRFHRLRLLRLLTLQKTAGSEEGNSSRCESVPSGHSPLRFIDFSVTRFCVLEPSLASYCIFLTIPTTF